MNIHEFQAKKILAEYGVSIPKGKEAYSVDEAVSVAKDIGGKKWVVKAQIHAGGRGKAGGVKIADSIEEVEEISKSLLGMQLVTHQTGPEGKKVNKIFIEQGINIISELYLGVVLDRSNEKYVMMASTEGGTEIEVVAKKAPEKIFKAEIDSLLGMQPYQARQLVFKLGLEIKYKFETLEFISAGAREDGADGVEGISGTKAREDAANNDIKKFIQHTGAGEHADELFAAVRQGMGLSDEEPEDDQNERS